MSWPQIWPNSGTCASQHFLFFDNRRKIKSRKTHFVGRPPLSRLRRRFAPLRGTQRRCAALRAAPPGRYAPRALRAQGLLQTRKKCRVLLCLLVGLCLNSEVLWRACISASPSLYRSGGGKETRGPCGVEVEWLGGDQAAISRPFIRLADPGPAEALASGLAVAVGRTGATWC